MIESNKKEENSPSWYDCHKDKYREYYKINKKKVLERSIKWREKNRERFNEIQGDYRKRNPNKLKIWRKKNPEKLLNQLKRQREKYPKKYRARYLAGNNIKVQGLCEKCKDKPSEERHHPDYNFPLKVLLLCKPCHQEAHYS